MFTHEEAMIPIMRMLADGEVRKRQEICQAMADHFALSEGERQDMLPSGGVTTYTSRAGWALSYLVKAELIERPKRGFHRITEHCRSILARGVESLTTADLRSGSTGFDT